MTTRTICLSFAIALALLAAAPTRAVDTGSVIPKLIPQPAQIVQLQGSFVVGANTPLRAGDGEVVREVGRQFKAMLGAGLPLRLDLAKESSRHDTIVFTLDPAKTWASPDAYTLDITTTGVLVSAGSALCA